MRSKEIEEYKKTLFLTRRQKEILVGVLLGDGHLEKMYSPDFGRLKIEHSYKQKSYVDWLYKEFQSWVRTKPRERSKRAFGKIYQNYGFSTYGHRLLGKFRERFYVDKRKIVPENLEKDINCLTLAIWYMDDGSIKSKKHKGVFLNTQGFDLRDIRKLQKILNDKFRIKSNLRNQTRNGKVGKQIYIGNISAERFIERIKPYIIPAMKYKIPKVLRLTELPKK